MSGEPLSAPESLPGEDGAINIEEARRAMGILKKYFAIESREDFQAAFDRGAGLVEVKGVGEVREEVLRVLGGLSDQEWVAVTGLPVAEADADADADADAEAASGGGNS